MSSDRLCVGLLLLAVSLPAAAAEDLRELQVQGRRGQSAEQARRDRYECHNWAVEQTGESPVAAPVAAAVAADEKAEKRRERVGRALAGAAIGGTVGSLFGDWHGAGEEILAGAAVGAGIGAATAGAGRKKESEPDGPSEYLRALTACLEGRGYSVALPSGAEAGESR